MTMQKIDVVTLIIQKKRESDNSNMSDALEALVKLVNGTAFTVTKITIEEM